MNTAAALRWSEDRGVRACNPATGLWLSPDGTGFYRRLQVEVAEADGPPDYGGGDDLGQRGF